MKHFIILLFTLPFASTFAQEKSKLGKGIINYVAEDSSYSAKLNFRFQALYSSALNINEQKKFADNHSYFGIRRARLKLQGFAHSPKLTYKVELGLSNEDMGGISEFSNDAPLLILDAYVNWNFWKNFNILFGQAKLPGNRERLISSAKLLFVDRSILNSQFNIDREAGFQLHHNFRPAANFLIREVAAISLGEGRNVTTGNIGGFSYTGRVEILPFGEFIGNGEYVGADIYREAKPKLAIGLSYNYNDNAVKTRSNRGTYMHTEHGYFETDISTLFADLMFKYRGFSILAEYAERSSTFTDAVEHSGAKTGDAVNSGTALNIQTAYVLPKGYAVSLRYTRLDFKSSSYIDQSEYTLGLSKFVVGHYLKVQADASYGEYTEGQDSFRYRLLLELQL